MNAISEPPCFIGPGSGDPGPLGPQLVARAVDVLDAERDVPVAGAELVALRVPVVRQLEHGVVAFGEQPRRAAPWRARSRPKSEVHIAYMTPVRTGELADR